MCSLMVQGSVLTKTASAQAPIGSMVANGLLDSKSLSPIQKWKRPERFQGTLLLCGGGTIPLSIRDEFYLLGNGNEGALVLIPSASPRSDGGNYAMWIDYWSSFRWKSIDVVHVGNRDGGVYLLKGVSFQDIGKRSFEGYQRFQAGDVLDTMEFK